MNKRKVIFVGGTSYSGSTFFDLILGNDPAGFSCGEVYAFFYPYRNQHLDPLCGCGNKDCRFWQNVLAGGSRRLYSTIFSMLPEVEFIVDSSKSPFWIESQSRYLAKAGIEVKHVLIWKTPEELAYSFKKRGYTHWDKAWLDYHRTYATIIPQWRSITYSELSTVREALEKVCGYIGIPYFHDKSKYWNKHRHLLFGSNSAKIHLYSKESLKFNRIKKDIETGQQISTNKPHRSISYQEINDERLIAEVDRIIQQNKLLQDVNSLLEARSVNAKDDKKVQNRRISLKPTELMAGRMKFAAKKIGSRPYAMFGKWFKNRSVRIP